MGAQTPRRWTSPPNVPRESGVRRLCRLLAVWLGEWRLLPRWWLAWLAWLGWLPRVRGSLASVRRWVRREGEEARASRVPPSSDSQWIFSGPDAFCLLPPCRRRRCLCRRRCCCCCSCGMAMLFARALRAPAGVARVATVASATGRTVTLRTPRTTGFPLVRTRCCRLRRRCCCFPRSDPLDSTLSDAGRHHTLIADLVAGCHAYLYAPQQCMKWYLCHRCCCRY